MPSSNSPRIWYNTGDNAELSRRITEMFSRGADAQRASASSAINCTNRSNTTMPSPTVHDIETDDADIEETTPPPPSPIRTRACNSTQSTAARRRRIKGIGVELEGGWHVPPATTIHHDGSVNVRANHVGEVSTPGPIDTLPLALAWTRQNYPSSVNSTCGLHVHLSVNNLNYGRLMETEFKDYFEQQLAQFLQDGLDRNAQGFELLRSRFNGDNRYCQKIFRPAEQIYVPGRYGDPAVHPRYSQLNFCYNRHGTVECRVFPCFPDPEDGCAAVSMFYKTVFDYLGRFKPTKDDSAVSLNLDIKAIAQCV